MVPLEYCLMRCHTSLKSALTIGIQRLLLCKMSLNTSNVMFPRSKSSLIDKPHVDTWPHYMSITNIQDRDIIRDMVVLENFLSEEEETHLFEEVDPYMKRLRYEFDHWDEAIHGYRETERLQWNEKNTAVLQRARDIAFPNDKQLSLVHVLDLAENGLIKPHIDSTRFCGDVIAGLSLLSNCVMRLVHHKEPMQYVDILLSRRSLYVMKGVARHDYTHEVLGNDCSLFKGNTIVKSRRLSIICRNEPMTTNK